MQIDPDVLERVRQIDPVSYTHLNLLIVSVSNISVYSLSTTAKKRNDLVRFNALLQVKKDFSFLDFIREVGKHNGSIRS